MKTTGWILTGMLAAAVTASADTTLTVYNGNIAVVRQTDDMTFRAGVQTVTVTGIPAQIEPASVRFSADGGVRLLEQKYRNDTANTAMLLRAYINRHIAVRLEDDRLVEGVLLSAADNVILRGEEGIIVLRADAIERYDLSEPGNALVTAPTLILQVDSGTAGRHATELSYITGGISWQAVYNAVVGEDERSLELSSMVSIENHSGMAFEDAALKVVAGTINRAQSKTPQPMYRAAAPQRLMAEDAMGFRQRTLDEYYLYELGRNVSIADGETSQISLYEPATVAARRVYSYDPHKNAEQVAATMEFTNSVRAGLGMPLPEGTVRVYRRDADGALELVGEDSIDHTARDEDVKVTMGYAFDLAGEWRVTDNRRISQRVQEQSVEISLRNRSDEDVTIAATDHLYGDWEILTSSHEYEKKDATTIEFTVDVPAGGEILVSYTARIQQ